MTRKAIIFFAVLLVITFSAAAQSKPAAAEISFTYTRQGGSGSNQFAVWVEDARGNYVKTIYATRFTAKGGWERRPLSILQWVKQSNLSKMPRAQIDALTGPTPRAGTLTYRWDGTNQAGAAVQAGEYKLFLEASLRNENRVIYSAVIPAGWNASSGDFRNVEVKNEYFGNGTAERGMISNVQVLVRKIS
jgi:hypothetical protein